MSLETIACPHCRKPAPWADNPHRPFCSERCRLIDLGQWADEGYRIPLPAADNVIPFPDAGDDKE